MNGSINLPSLVALKDQAKRLRTSLAKEGQTIGHGHALELLAHQHGFKDWNTLHASIGNIPARAPVILGQKIRGHYLHQPFTGEVIGVQRLGQNDRFRVTFRFDEPVDVVTFDSFSAFRRRVSCTIGLDGTTAEKTSDGQPQLKLAL